MSLIPQVLGVIIGGLLPAVFFGINGVLSKVTAQTGISIGPYLVCIGLGVMIVGVCFQLWYRDMAVSATGVAYALITGITWGIGAGLLGIALSKYGAPLSRLAPLYNMNTLIAVLLSLWIFAEWQDVHVMKLLVGAVLVILGGTLVALA